VEASAVVDVVLPEAAAGLAAAVVEVPLVEPGEERR